VFEFREGGVVLFWAHGQGAAAPPPFCFVPGCISGPRQRDRMQALGQRLGWLPFETDEDKKWTPILFH
jgi:hypothetical protein